MEPSRTERELPARPPLIGRDRAIYRLLTLAEDASGGHGSLALVTGQPGMGKTRLAEEISARLATLGFALRWAVCSADAGAPPYWPWTRLLVAHADAIVDNDLLHDVGSAAGRLTALAPDLAPRLHGHSLGGVSDGHLEPAQERFRLFDAVASLVRRAATRQPLLLVVDDLHWADTESLLLLRFLARELRTMRVLLVGGYRPAEVEPGSGRERLLASLGQEGQVVHLGPLGDDEVEVLLGQAAGELRADTVAAVRRRSAGNPLFVLEFGRLLAASDADHPPTPAVLPLGVRAVLDDRLDRLSPACIDVLSAAAVAGQDPAVDLVASVAGVAQAVAFTLLDEALRAELLHPVVEGSRYRLVHPIFREVLYERLPSARRAELHRRVAEAYEASTDPDRHLTELAFHYLRAGAAADPAKQLAYSTRAGEQALGLCAYEDAAEHFRRALDAAARCSSGDGERGELLQLLGDACLRAGDLPAAREAFQHAAEIARSRGRPDELARAALGFGAGLSGFEVKLFDRTQLDLLEEALAALGPDDSVLRAWTLARLSVSLSFVASEQRCRVLSEDAVAMARRLADDGALAYALASHCDAIAGPDHSETRLAEATEVVRLAVGARDPGMELLGRRLRLVALLELGDINGVDAENDAYARTARELHSPLYLWYVPHWRAMRALVQGHLDACERLIVEGEAIGDRAHSENAILSVRGQQMAVAVARGDPTRAERILQELIDHRLPVGASAERYRVNLLAQQGKRAEARVRLAHLLAGDLTAGRDDSQWLNGLCQLAEATATVGDRHGAAVLYPLLAPYGARFAVDGIGSVWLGSVAHHLGSLAHILGRRGQAVDHFEAALAAHRQAGAPLLVAATLRRYAAAATRNHADQLRHEALTIEADLGIVRAAGDHADVPQQDTFLREGEYWTMVFTGTVARVKDSKGMRDIAHLLARPGREVHAFDLYSGGAAPRTGHAGEVLDAAAKRAYRTRLADLEDEIADAEAASDPERAARAGTERDALVAELAAAYGLGGRSRRSGDPVERARSAVSWRIRDALGRVAEAHPPLGRHLKNSLRTGTYLSYQPEQPIAWRL